MAAPSNSDGSDPQRTIAVTNLSDTLKEDHLRDLFDSCGKIDVMCVKFVFGKGRVCYIRFEDSQSALAAQVLSGSDLDGKALSIELVNDSIFANYKPPETAPNPPNDATKETNPNQATLTRLNQVL